MQSVEPGSGTSSTSRPPAALNQPILLAMAKGAVADVTVRAHQPTRSVSADAADAPANVATATIRSPSDCLIRPPSFLFPRAPPSSTRPRTGRAGGAPRRLD